MYCSRRDCNAIAQYECGGCHQVGYCSQECQEYDWINGNHQQECHPYIGMKILLENETFEEISTTKKDINLHFKEILAMDKKKMSQNLRDAVNAVKNDQSGQMWLNLTMIPKEWLFTMQVNTLTEVTTKRKIPKPDEYYSLHYSNNELAARVLFTLAELVSFASNRRIFHDSIHFKETGTEWMDNVVAQIKTRPAAFSQDITDLYTTTNLERVKEILDPNKFFPAEQLIREGNQNGNTPLHTNKNANVIKYLLTETRANCIDFTSLINYQNENGETPLYVLCNEFSAVDFANQQQILTYFLNAGADPNVQDKDGNTVLHNTKLSQTILDQIASFKQVKIDLEIKNNADNTPMHMLVMPRKGRIPNILQLIKNDARKKPQFQQQINKKDQTPLEVAIENYRDLELMQSEFELQQQTANVEYLCSLPGAIRSKTINRLKSIMTEITAEWLKDIMKKVLFNMQEEFDKTLRIDDEKQRKKEEEKQRKEEEKQRVAEESKKKKEEERNQELRLLLTETKPDVIKDILFRLKPTRDQIVNACDSSTPLHENTNVDVIKFFFDSKNKTRKQLFKEMVNLHDKEGKTPIQKQKDNAEIVEILYRNGASLDDLNNETLSDEVANVVKKLRTNAAALERKHTIRSLCFEYNKHDAETTLNSLELESPLSATEIFNACDGTTPLHVNSDPDVVTLFLRNAGMKGLVNRREKESGRIYIKNKMYEEQAYNLKGEVPIQSQRNCPLAVSALLQEGADATAKNSQGKTIWHYLYPDILLNTIQILKQYSPQSINSQDSVGNTALLLYLQIRSVSPEVLDLFIDEFLTTPGINVTVLNVEGSSALTFLLKDFDYDFAVAKLNLLASNQRAVMNSSIISALNTYMENFAADQDKVNVLTEIRSKIQQRIAKEPMQIDDDEIPEEDRIIVYTRPDYVDEHEFPNQENTSNEDESEPIDQYSMDELRQQINLNNQSITEERERAEFLQQELDAMKTSFEVKIEEMHTEIKALKQTLEEFRAGKHERELQRINDIVEELSNRVRRALEE